MGARDSESRGPWKILGWDNDDAEGGSSAAGSGNLQIKRLINIRSTRVQRGNNSTLPIFLEITFPANYKKLYHIHKFQQIRNGNDQHSTVASLGE